MYTVTLRLSILSIAVLLLASLFPVLTSAQERSSTDGRAIEVEANTTLEANYNNSRSNRSTIAAPADANVCDGVTCADGSCAATADMCDAEDMAVDSVCNGYLCDNGECAASAAMCGVTDVAEDMAVDSVCNGYLCDSGQCVSDKVWCDVDFDFAVDSVETAADSVCSGYLCNDGTCVSSQGMCEMDFTELPAMATKCPADSPIRCGDGSCSSEVGICRAIESRISPTPAERARTDTNDNEQRTNSGQAQNHNSSRSNRTEGAANGDLDSDGDGIPDEVERAQDYNSSRSNKPARGAFSDIDGDGRPEVTMRAGGFVKIGSIEGEATSRVNAGEVVCWGRAEDDNGKVYAWGQGICIASEATANASDTAQTRLAALQVRGDDVRNWNEAQQAAWREFRVSRASSSAEERLIEKMVEETQTNQRIQEITSDDDSIEMQYNAEMRLFGFIPMQRTVTARAAVDGEVQVDYPWYRFLSRVPEDSAVRDTLSELQTLLATKSIDKATPLLMQ